MENKNDKITIYRDEKNFYDKLKEIRNMKISVNTEWSGAYLVSTYTLSNGEVWEYWEDMDYGVSYCLTRVN